MCWNLFHSSLSLSVFSSHQRLVYIHTYIILQPVTHTTTGDNNASVNFTGGGGRRCIHNLIYIQHNLAWQTWRGNPTCKLEVFKNNYIVLILPPPPLSLSLSLSLRVLQTYILYIYIYIYHQDFFFFFFWGGARGGERGKGIEIHE